MTESRRFASRWLILLFAAVGTGCAVEVTNAGPPTPHSPSPPYSVRDVFKLLGAGISEEAVRGRVGFYGIEDKPSVAEIQELRCIGAGDHLIAWLMAASILDRPECPPKPTVAFSVFLWEPFPVFPGFLPIRCWYWLEGRWQLVPWDEPVVP
jgi:hypothetical protein